MTTRFAEPRENAVDDPLVVDGVVHCLAELEAVERLDRVFHRTEHRSEARHVANIDAIGVADGRDILRENVDRHVCFAGFERSGATTRLTVGVEDDRFERRGLAPVVVEALKHDFFARGEVNDLIRAGSVEIFGICAGNRFALLVGRVVLNGPAAGNRAGVVSELELSESGGCAVTHRNGRVVDGLSALDRAQPERADRARDADTRVDGSVDRPGDVFGR